VHPRRADLGTVTCSGNPSSFTTSGLSTLAVNIVPSGSDNPRLIVNGNGAHSVVNLNMINQALTFNGNGTDSVDNRGTINPGIQKTGAGTLSISSTSSMPRSTRASSSTAPSRWAQATI
jgi:hypothetical protein